MQVADHKPHAGTPPAARGGASTALPWLQPRAAAPRAVRALRQFHIHGVTQDGRSFRPSDWAERLAGAMSAFRPGAPRGGAAGIGAHIGYSPWCVPQVVDEVRCVLVSEALRELEPMAWDFVMNFARDNQLRVREVLEHAAPVATAAAREEALPA
jgi:hypothetical protein